MELIIFIIIIAIAVSGSKTGKEKSKKSTTDVWSQVDNGASEFLKTFVGSGRREQVTKGIHDLEDMFSAVKRKTIQKAKRKEEADYQQEQEAFRKRQEDDRKRREFEERQKKKLELQKKNAEQRRRALEKEKREREERALLERCQTASQSLHPVSDDSNQEKDRWNMGGSSETAATAVEYGEDKKTALPEERPYRVEEYLDPLTSSFYPKVDDYLFPTIASFYPDTDTSVFSLQNETNVL